MDKIIKLNPGDTIRLTIEYNITNTKEYTQEIKIDTFSDISKKIIRKRYKNLYTKKTGTD